MQLQLVPKSIKRARSHKLAARWAAVHVDPRIAPPGGIEMCTCAAWEMKVERGNYPMPRHLKSVCVSFVVLQCPGRLRLGLGTSYIIGVTRVKNARARMP
jgi:hypothetical protein